MKKVILILGASSDVGLKFIQDYHMEYDKIFAQYYKGNESLKKLSSGLGSKIDLIQSDFSSDESIDRLISYLLEQEETITHVLHLPASKLENIRFKKLSWDEYQRDIDIQLKSIVKILHKLIPKMEKLKYGKIVFMLSSCTNNEPPKYLNNYVTVKYALLGLMRSLASEYAEKSININAVSPSMMDTKFLENVPDMIIEYNIENSPMKRLVKIEEVTSVISLLLSDESGYITGQNIVIAGGNK